MAKIEKPFFHEPTIAPPPPVAAEIEFRSPALAGAAGRVAESLAVVPLREATARKAEFDARAEAERAEIAAQLASANALQDELLGLRRGVADLDGLIARAEADLGFNKDLQSVLLGEARARWMTDQRLSDHAIADTTSRFAIKAIGGWIADWRAERAVLQNRLVEFCTLHGVSP